jgi:hypothetical protein
MRKALRAMLLSPVLAAAVALVAPPSAALADTNPYGPEDVCGSGFHQIDRQGINGGVIYLMYNAGTGQNCVATIKTVGVGRPTPTSAVLQVRGDSNVHQDSGRYKYFAGPVKVGAPHRCVRWGGSTYLAAYLSPFGHCR